MLDGPILDCLFNWPLQNLQHVVRCFAVAQTGRWLEEMDRNQPLSLRNEAWAGVQILVCDQPNNLGLSDSSRLPKSKENLLPALMLSTWIRKTKERFRSLIIYFKQFFLPITSMLARHYKWINHHRRWIRGTWNNVTGKNILTFAPISEPAKCLWIWHTFFITTHLPWTPYSQIVFAVRFNKLFWS